MPWQASIPEISAAVALPLIESDAMIVPESADQRGVLAALCQYVSTQQPEIAVLYLFGSRAKRTDRPGSDWDFGVVSVRGMPSDPWWLPQLTVDLAQLVGSNRVDVVLLDAAAASLAFAVIRDGIVVFERSTGDAIRFRVKAVAQYLDTAPLRSARFAFLTAPETWESRRG